MYTQYQGANPQIYHHDQPLELECGLQLDKLRIAYHTYGTLSPERDNVIWVCHALTANSDVADWWPNTVVRGGLFDPSRYFIVCANKLGSCYGSSSALDYAPNYMDVPLITIRDITTAHTVLADALGIDRIKLLIGGSTGGMQAMEWAIMQPDRIENLALSVTQPTCTPWIVADNEAQRMILRTDKTLYNSEMGGGGEGLAAARALSMLMYRNHTAFNITQNDDQPKLQDFRAASYQRYQGDKLRRRFDARCYYHLLNSLDSHNVGRGRGGVAAALSTITARTVVMSVDSDLMFPTDDVQAYARHIPNATFHEIASQYGHDGFLIETPEMTRILGQELAL